MKLRDRFVDVLALLLILFALVPAPAHAYFDLNTGTYIVQLLFGFAAAFMITMRAQIKQFFGSGKSAPSASKDVESDKQAADSPVGDESETGN